MTHKPKVDQPGSIVWFALLLAVLGGSVRAEETPAQEQQSTAQLNAAFNDASRSAACGYILSPICEWAISTGNSLERLWGGPKTPPPVVPVVQGATPAHNANFPGAGSSLGEWGGTGCADGSTECAGRADYRRAEKPPVFEPEAPPAAVEAKVKTAVAAPSKSVALAAAPAPAPVLSAKSSLAVPARAGEKLVVHCSCDATFSLDNKLHKGIKVIVELSKSNSCEDDAQKWRNSNPPPLTKKDIVCSAQACASSEPFLEKNGYTCIEPDGKKWRETAAGKKWMAGQ